MPKNDFKAFAISENANVLKQTEYELLPALDEGFQSGIARSEELNKVWRQASTITSVIASFMANKSGQDVLDNGDLNTLQNTLLKALLNNSISQLDDRYLNAELNLSDINDAKAACDNLGLTQTVELAAGALQKDKNLSDIKDKPQARKNLELGTAATSNVQTSATDDMPNALMANGAWGLGGLLASLGANDTVTCFYSGGVGAKTNPINDRGFAFVNLAISGSYRCRLALDYTNAAPRIFYQNILDNTYNPYIEFYTTANKPNAADNDFVSKSNGGTYNNAIKIISDNSLTLQAKSSGRSQYILAINSSGANYWFVGAGSDSNKNVALQNYISGASITLGEDGVISLSRNTTISGSVTPTNYTNFDARYLQGIRPSGTEEYVDIPYPGQASLPAGAFPTAFVGTTKSTGSGISFHISRVYYRRAQKYIGGAWVNI